MKYKEMCLAFGTIFLKGTKNTSGKKTAKNLNDAVWEDRLKTVREMEECLVIIICSSYSRSMEYFRNT